MVLGFCAIAFKQLIGSDTLVHVIDIIIVLTGMRIPFVMLAI